MSPVSSVRWGGGEAPVGAAGQSPAALMDGPMMGSAQHGQIGQIGRAPIQPGAQMVTLAPGQRAGTVGEHTAAVPDGQGGPLGRGDDPGGPAQVQRLAGAPPRIGGRRGLAARSHLLSPRSGWSGWSGSQQVDAGPQVGVVLEVLALPGCWPLRWPLGGWPWPGWRRTRTRVTALSQASRRQASGSRGPAQPSSPPTP